MPTKPAPKPCDCEDKIKDQAEVTADLLRRLEKLERHVL